MFGYQILKKASHILLLHFSLLCRNKTTLGYAAGEIVSTKDDSVTLTVNGAQVFEKK